jgi:hypothetical protein
MKGPIRDINGCFSGTNWRTNDWQIRFRIRTLAPFGLNQPGRNMFVVRAKKLTTPLPLIMGR